MTENDVALTQADMRKLGAKIAEAERAAKFDRIFRGLCALVNGIEIPSFLSPKEGFIFKNTEITRRMNFNRALRGLPPGGGWITNKGN